MKQDPQIIYYGNAPQILQDNQELVYPEQLLSEEQKLGHVEHLDLTHTSLEVDIANVDQLKPEDFTMNRKQGLGASDSSVILGVNPYKTQMELIREKLSTGITEEERLISKQTAVRKGNDLEPLIIDKFMQYFGQKTIKPADQYRMKDYPFLKVNFDGVTGDPQQYIPVEIKVATSKGEKHYNPSKAMFMEEAGFGPLLNDPSGQNMSVMGLSQYYGVPPYYFTQLQYQMMGLKAPFGYLCVLFEREWWLRVHQIWRDEITINNIIIQGYKLWEQIELMRSQK